ncbi:MAG: hypothetical protein ACXV5H_10390 [Halobacteriota archaeon]
MDNQDILISRYAAILQELDALPTWCLWVPRKKDPNKSARKSIPIFPFFVVKSLVRQHIRRRLVRIDKHLSLELARLKGQDKPRSVLDELKANDRIDALTEQIDTAEKVLVRMPALKVSNLEIILLVAVALFILQLAAPGNPEIGAAAHVAQGIVSSNLENIYTGFQEFLKTLPTTTVFQSDPPALLREATTVPYFSIKEGVQYGNAAALLPVLYLTILSVILLPILVWFNTKRWILNRDADQPDARGMSDTCCLAEVWQGSGRCCGVYQREQSAFQRWDSKYREFPLDVFIYVIIIFPALLFLVNGLLVVPTFRLENFVSSWAAMTVDALLGFTYSYLDELLWLFVLTGVTLMSYAILAYGISRWDEREGELELALPSDSNLTSTGDMPTDKAAHTEPHNAETVVPKKSPTMASILTLLIPGLGHVYVGDEQKGIRVLIGAIIVSLTAASFLTYYHLMLSSLTEYRSFLYTIASISVAVASFVGYRVMFAARNAWQKAKAYNNQPINLLETGRYRLKLVLVGIWMSVVAFGAYAAYDTLRWIVLTLLGYPGDSSAYLYLPLNLVTAAILNVVFLSVPFHYLPQLRKQPKGKSSASRRKAERNT